MIRNRNFIAALLLLLGTGALSTTVALRPTPVVVATNLERLPMEIDGYHAVEDSFPESVYKELNADKHVYRHYRAADGSVIDLYIGYYGTAKGGRTGHNPYACLPSAGAAIVDAKQIYLQQASAHRTVPVNYILARKDGLNMIMLHWYQMAGNTVVSTGLRQNTERFLGKVIRNRNDGAYVQLIATVSDNEIPTATKKLEKLSSSVSDLIPTYWPKEQ